MLERLEISYSRDANRSQSRRKGRIRMRRVAGHCHAEGESGRSKNHLERNAGLCPISSRYPRAQCVHRSKASCSSMLAEPQARSLMGTLYATPMNLGGFASPTHPAKTMTR